MISYTIRRLLMAIPTLFLVAAIIFFILHLTPGEPVSALVGPMVDIDQIEQIRREWGLNQPVYLQYFTWIFQMFKGNFGISYNSGNSVIGYLLTSVPVTIVLAGSALFIGIIVGIPLGIISAINRNTYIDRITSLFAVGGISIPKFWFGYLLLFFFAVRFELFPVTGWVDPWESLSGWLYHATLPTLALSTDPIARIARMTRSSMLEVLQEDYVTTARSKGLREFYVITKHTLRNALVPIITVIGLSLALMMAGVVTLEFVFNINGMGRVMITALQRRDYPVVQAVVLWVGFGFILINLLTDLIYAFIDPRVRYQ